MVDCACGCGTRIPRKGKNGKPRKYLRGHQTRGRKMVDRSSEAYWENRVRRMNTSAPLCRCGCGDPVTVTVSWLRRASENGTRPVSDVFSGARSAISVRLAIDAVREGGVREWKESYDEALRPQATSRKES